MNRICHELTQGSDEWIAFRANHHGASEAAAMLGLSKKVKRNELLHAKVTCVPRDFPDWVQRNILDYGHEVEAKARPIVEEIIGDELYPATYSMGVLSASCDGINMAGDIAFEHKQWNAELAAMVRDGILPEEHAPQCQQVLMVTGAERLIFVISDGTRENMVHMWVTPDPEWQRRIVAGWKQFDADAAVYVPQEKTVAPVAAPIEALPAVFVQVQGSLSVSDNLKTFGERLTAFVEGINKKPETDQDFADAEAAIKALSRAEEALQQAKAGALEQVATVADMQRAVDLHYNLARNTRLMLEKLVKAEKENRKTAIVTAGQTAFKQYVDAHNATIGKPYMPQIPADFGGVIKSLKSLDSIQNAVDTELARVKILADEAFEKIQKNLASLRELGGNHTFLFADVSTLVQKPNDDLVTLIGARITEHEAREAEKRKQEAANTTPAAEARGPAVVSAPAEEVAAVRGLSFKEIALIQPSQAVPDSGARITLGQINSRLAPISVSKDALAQLGIQPVGKERAAVLYRESDYPGICTAIIKHVVAVSSHKHAA